MVHISNKRYTAIPVLGSDGKRVSRIMPHEYSTLMRRAYQYTHGESSMSVAELQARRVAASEDTTIRGHLRSLVLRRYDEMIEDARTNKNRRK